MQTTPWPTRAARKSRACPGLDPGAAKLLSATSTRSRPGNHLLLLRHRNGWTSGVLRGALQHGHRARVVARATIRCRRIVAIELATCRSGRTGGASGSVILGNLRRRELIGVVAGG